ncbi:hypothetical protein L842_3236 [Mycobacterium intracellulare MIN_052511_1280]|nr:hypothetical protein L842_3236 [Mycobacterium intracellulare MIN_052511_1280]
MGDGAGFSSVVTQICSQWGSSECSWQNHWFPTFLTTSSLKALSVPLPGQ